MEKDIESTSSPQPYDNFATRRTAKRKGEAAEAAFLSKTTYLGFDVAKPWGDSAQFDFIVHTGSRCWRVQVKSAREHRKRRYTVKATGESIPYTSDNIDFFVVYIVPVDTWYVIPVAAMSGLSGLWLYPHPGSKARFERYREAWCLMACPHDGKCNPEISVARRCLAHPRDDCPFRPTASQLAAR